MEKKRTRSQGRNHFKHLKPNAIKLDINLWQAIRYHVRSKGFQKKEQAKNAFFETLHRLRQKKTNVKEYHPELREANKFLKLV